MDKLHIFHEVKASLKSKIDELSYSDYLEQKKDIVSYLDFLERLIHLPVPENTEQGDELIEDSPHEMEGYSETIEEASSVIEGYPLRRKLRGGILEGADIFVPESIIRSMALEENDIIKPNTIGDGKYHFKLLKKGDSSSSNRVELKYCITEKDGSLLTTSTKMKLNGDTEFIKIDEVPYTFRISESDIQEFDIKEGSIIDLAYYQNAPQTCKVIWIHQTEDEHSRPMKAGFYKEKEAVHSKEELDSDEESKIIKPDLFSGKTICVIGCEGRKAQFKESIEACGGQMIWASGNEEEERLASFIRKSDCVIIITIHTSHRGSTTAVSLCKDFKVPFDTIQSRGIKSLIESVHAILSK